MNVGRVSSLNGSSKHTIIAELILLSYACWGSEIQMRELSGRGEFP